MRIRVLQLVTAPIRLSGRLLHFSLTVVAKPFRMLAPGKRRRDLVEPAGPPLPACSCAQHEAHPGMYSATDVQAMLGMVKEALRAKVMQLLASITAAAFPAWGVCRTTPSRTTLQPLSLFCPHCEAEGRPHRLGIVSLRGQDALPCTPQACCTQVWSSHDVRCPCRPRPCVRARIALQSWQQPPPP